MNTLHNIFLSLIGDYEPIITTLEDNSVVVSPDWSWIMSAALFILIIFCVLKMIGGLVCSK